MKKDKGAFRQVLTDLDAGAWVESGEWTVASGTIRKRMLRGGISHGIDVVEVDNGVLRFSVLPTRGMSLWKGECGGMALGWESPVRHPVHPAYIADEARGGLGWLAGFNEWVVRCGLNWNGAPGLDRVTSNTGSVIEVNLPLHGRIANLPAHRVEAFATERDGVCVLGISGVVDECTMFGTKLRLHTQVTTAVGSRSLRIEDTVENLSSASAEVELLYHCNYGRPFLGAGSRLALPTRLTVPRDPLPEAVVRDWAVYGPPEAGTVESCFWHVPLAGRDGRSLAVLHDAARMRGTGMRFAVSELPCFAQWKHCGALQDGYVTGLEPATNYPNARLFEREHGRVRVVEPGGSCRASVELEVYDSPAAVTAVLAEVAAIQGAVAPDLRLSPLAEYSPAGQEG